MQKYEAISKLSSNEFKRLTGVQKTTFTEMIAVVKEAENKRTSRRGKPPHLSMEDRLLMALEYLREYRTYFHLGQSFRWGKNIQGIVDSGYTGIKKLQRTSLLPKKRSRNQPLTNEERRKNQSISSERVLNEIVIGRLKRFKILSDKYRNRRKRFGLRFNLIAGIDNWEQKHAERDQNTRKASSFGS